MSEVGIRFNKKIFSVHNKYQYRVVLNGIQIMISVCQCFFSLLLLEDKSLWLSTIGNSSDTSNEAKPKELQ